MREGVETVEQIERWSRDRSYPEGDERLAQIFDVRLLVTRDFISVLLKEVIGERDYRIRLNRRRPCPVVA